MPSALQAHDVLAATLAEARAALSSPVNIGAVDAVLTHLASTRSRPDDRSPSAALAALLVAFAGEDADRKAALADVVGIVARRLAPAGEPPSDGAAGQVWQALLDALDRLFGAGAWALGRPAFLSDRFMDLLRAEARHQRPPGAGRHAAAGRVLANLAVSRKLADLVATAVGFAVVPTYNAVYQYDTPGSHVHTHVDSRGYEVVFHLVVEHIVPSGSSGSALVVHRPGGAEPTRLPVKPAEGVVLCGRGTVHSWEPMGDEESRSLIAIGFSRSDQPAA